MTSWIINEGLCLPPHCHCLAYLIRSSYPEVFLVNSVLKICTKFTGENPWRSVNSVQLSKILKRHPSCCFSPVNLPHIFRTPFSKDTSVWLLLFDQDSNLANFIFNLILLIWNAISTFTNLLNNDVATFVAIPNFSVRYVLKK